MLALELERLAYIHLDNIQTGSKLRLSGKVEIRRGTIMLRNTNVEVVWGNKEGGFKTSGITSFNQV